MRYGIHTVQLGSRVFLNTCHATSSNGNDQTAEHDGKQPLAGWKIALIVICLCTILALGIWVWIRRRKQRAQPKVVVDYSKIKTEESREESEVHEVANVTARWEVDGRYRGVELPVHAHGMYEMEQPASVHEM